MGQARDEAGNIWETDAQGNPVRLIQPGGQQGGQMYTLPPDPVQQANIENIRRDNDRADSNAARDAAMQQQRRALLDAQIRKAIADAAKAEQGTAGAQTGDARLQAKLASLNALVDQINRVQELYESGPGETSGLAGLGDYLPNSENRQFDTAAAGLAEQGLAAFRVPGVGAQSDTELRQFVQANRPSASNFDTEIEEKLRQLRNRVNATREAMRLPPAEWTGSIPEAQRPNALTVPRLVGGEAMEAGQAGATTTQQPVNPAYQEEYTAWLTQNAGAFTPQQYAAMRASLDQKYGYDQNPGDYAAEGQRILDRFKAGGSQNWSIPPMEVPMDGTDQLRNNIVNNPLGAAAVGALDMGGFGGVSALAPEQFAALARERPGATALGQIGGAIGGTAALGRLGKETIGRALPSMLGGGAKAQFGRNLAADTAFSGIYGGVTEGDPLGGAALGAVGSAGGQGVGKLLGATVGGIAVSPAVQRLRDLGVRTTTGQNLGGIARSIEDAMTSAPGLGDIVGARRVEGLRDFNRAAFDEAGSPIGATVSNIGEEGVQELIGQYGNPLDSGMVGDAYDRATAGVRVPLDPQFTADMRGVAQARNTLPDDYASRFDVVRQNRIAPIEGAGELTGDSYQQAFRGLKGSRSSAAGAAPGFEQEYRDALTQAMDALTAQIQRGGGQNVVTGLRTADQAYRGAKTLERAVQAARNGTRSGEVQVFAPSQLNDAATQASRKYGGGRQMGQLIDDGQSVLPSTVPDSGTGRRIATMALPAALGGSATLGGGIGYGTGGVDGAQSGAMTGLGTAGLLALLGTRRGQSVLNTVLFDRPQQAQRIGRLLRDKKGLFGSAAVPLALEAGL